MSNATDTEERIRQGFVELLERLRAESVEDPSKKIRSNTEARERAQNRVWHEYNAIGLLPPSDLALSVTDALIAREEDIERQTDEAFSPHEKLLDGQQKGLDDLEASLRLLSNGAPLGPSTDSQTAPQPEPPPVIPDTRTFDRMG